MKTGSVKKKINAFIFKKNKTREILTTYTAKIKQLGK